MRVRSLLGSSLAALLALAWSVLAATPSHADPEQVPDTGVRPWLEVEVELPDGSTLPGIPDTPLGPLVAEIATVELDIALLTSELAELTWQYDLASAAVLDAELAWQAAGAELAEAQEAFDELVVEAFRDAASVPGHLYGSQLRDLSAHAPGGLELPVGLEGAAHKLLRCQETAAEAAQTLATAQLTEQDLAAAIDTIGAQLAELRDELAELRKRNTEQFVASELAREAAERAGAPGQYPVNAPVNGYQAHPRALQAVQYALAQLGKPYQWGAQGPDRYDCSGLMWDAYRSVGETIPRVSRDQYWGTRHKLVTRSAAVARQGLLPGDLVFFSPDPNNWRSIGHVGMYIGSGRMVQAPTTGDVVKVSPVWWSRFFAATRVIDAVPAPDATPTPPPAPPAPPAPPPPPTTSQPPDPTGPPTPTPAEPTDPPDDPTDPPTPAEPGPTPTPPGQPTPAAEPATEPTLVG